MNTSKTGQIWRRLVDCILLISFVILNYNFARCTIDKIGSRVYRISLYYFFTTEHASIIISIKIWINRKNSMYVWWHKANGILIHYLKKYKIVHHVGRQFGSLVKWNTHLSYDLSILLPDINSREMKTYAHKRVCNQMFIATLFIIAPNWKQLRFPSTCEWINKLYTTM